MQLQCLGQCELKTDDESCALDAFNMGVGTRVLTRESVGAAFPSQQHKEIITKFGSRIGDARVVEAKGLSGAFDRRTLRQSNGITNYREVPGRGTFRTAVVSSTESDYDTDSVTLFDY